MRRGAARTTAGGGAADRLGGRLADAALALMLLAIVGMMIVPLPTPLLDLLIDSEMLSNFCRIAREMEVLPAPEGEAMTSMTPRR